MSPWYEVRMRTERADGPRLTIPASKRMAMRRLFAAAVTIAGAAALVAGCSSPAAHRGGAAQTGTGGAAAVAAPPPAATKSNRLLLGIVVDVADGSALVGVRDSLFREDLGATVAFQPVDFASSAAAESALVHDQLDAAYLNPVSAVAAWQATGGGVRVVAGAASSKGQSSVVLVVTAKFIATESGKVYGLLKGQVQASQLLELDPLSAWRMAAAELTALGQRTSAPQFAREAATFRFSCDPVETSILAQARQAAAARTLKPVSSLASMYDLAPVDQLLRAAGFAPVG
jgi:ABC-type nitrate/sulfonate/bicarbonate transport system substrate-binding protein